MTKSSDDKRKRVTSRFDGDDYQRILYWSQKRGLTVSEYVHDAVLIAIAHENMDYDVPDIQIQRMNQLIGTVETLSSNVESMETTFISSMDSLLSLTRGDNYLLESEDGEL